MTLIPLHFRRNEVPQVVDVLSEENAAFLFSGDNSTTIVRLEYMSPPFGDETSSEGTYSGSGSVSIL